MSKNEYDLKFYEVEEKFSRLLHELPARVTNIAVNDFKDNFRRQGYRAAGGGVIKWKKRKKSKSKRDETRAILIKSGRLRRGIQPAPQAMTARVINRVPYAEALNEGSKASVQVKSHKRHKWKSVKVKVKGKSKNLKQRTSVTVVRSHRRKNNLDARPFMITTPALLNEIDTYIDRKIQLIIK